MTNVIFDATKGNGIILEKDNTENLIVSMIFLLLNSRNRLTYPEQKQAWNNAVDQLQDIATAAGMLDLITIDLNSIKYDVSALETKQKINFKGF